MPPNLAPLALPSESADGMRELAMVESGNEESDVNHVVYSICIVVQELASSVGKIAVQSKIFHNSVDVTLCQNVILLVMKLQESKDLLKWDQRLPISAVDYIGVMYCMC